MLLSQPDVSLGKSSVKQRQPAARGKTKTSNKGPAAKARPSSSARTARPAKPAKPAKRTTKPAAKQRQSKPAPTKPAAKLAPAAPAKVSAKPAPKPAAKTKAAPPVVAQPVAPPPPAPPKKPSFYEAIGIYEAGVRGLQRHDYAGAAESFRQVLQRYPEERELIERAQLYLRVCERETAQRPAGPKTTAERVYAATMALSAGDADAALGHVKNAIEQEPGSHHAHYMMAVIRSTRSETDQAVEHLRRAIELNPDSRSVARQDADLERLRQHPTVRTLLEEIPGQAKAAGRPRR